MDFSLEIFQNTEKETFGRLLWEYAFIFQIGNYFQVGKIPLSGEREKRKQKIRSSRDFKNISFILEKNVRFVVGLVIEDCFEGVMDGTLGIHLDSFSLYKLLIDS